MRRKFKSVSPKTDVTNQCNRCKKFYMDESVVILEEGPVCLNCLDAVNPQDINKMLAVGFSQKYILTIHNIQYMIGDHEELLASAIYAVNMFDQANTGNAIEESGSRGKILKDAIDELRDLINKNGKMTILTHDQVSGK